MRDAFGLPLQHSYTTFDTAAADAGLTLPDGQGRPLRFASGAGHFVGMGVHDVGDYSLPLQVGMVIAVEPIIEIPEENIHIRIEDTVLITEDGAEILSAAVPKEVDEVLALAERAHVRHAARRGAGGASVVLRRSEERESSNDDQPTLYPFHQRL